MSTSVFLNRIVTAIPVEDGHQKFLEYVPSLIADERERRLYSRLAAKVQIEKRYSVLQPSADAEHLDANNFYRHGAFPSTGERMDAYKRFAFPLAARAVREIFAEDSDLHRQVTHVIVTSCTGFYAPGLDLELLKEFKLSATVERSLIGFMGCYAAFNALKTAWHVVRSQPGAKVLTVNVELCSLHLQKDFNLEQLLAFTQFADGCAAALISAEPVGMELQEFRCDVFDEARELIRWEISDQGFDMFLSTRVPQALGTVVPDVMSRWLSADERAAVRLWAIHPGGRSILDVVQDKLQLSEAEMRPSREVLKNFGNMSSATIMFVLRALLDDPRATGPGIAMAFGPGLTMEGMRFHKRTEGEE